MHKEMMVHPYIFETRFCTWFTLKLASLTFPGGKKVEKVGEKALHFPSSFNFWGRY